MNASVEVPPAHLLRPSSAVLRPCSVARNGRAGRHSGGARRGLRCITAAGSPACASPGAWSDRRTRRWCAPWAASRRTGVCVDRRAAAGLVVARSSARAARWMPNRFRVLSFDYLAAAATIHRHRQCRRSDVSQASPPTTRPSCWSACSITSASSRCAPLPAAPTAAWSRWPLASAIRSAWASSRHRRGRPRASDGHRLAQRSAPDRALRRRLRPAEGRPAARARAGDVDLPQRRGVRGALRRRARRETASDSCSRSSSICSRAAAITPTGTGPSPFCACRSPSTCIAWMPTRIFVPTTHVAIREDQLVPLADMRAMVARLPAARLHEISSIYGHDAFLEGVGSVARHIRCGARRCCMSKTIKTGAPAPDYPDGARRPRVR